MANGRISPIRSFLFFFFQKIDIFIIEINIIIIIEI